MCINSIGCVIYFDGRLNCTQVRTLKVQRLPVLAVTNEARIWYDILTSINVDLPVMKSLLNTRVRLDDAASAY